MCKQSILLLLLKMLAYLLYERESVIIVYHAIDCVLLATNPYIKTTACEDTCNYRQQHRSREPVEVSLVLFSNPPLQPFLWVFDIQWYLCPSLLNLTIQSAWSLVDIAVLLNDASFLSSDFENGCRHVLRR
jgi:hypothetical protein